MAGTLYIIPFQQKIIPNICEKFLIQEKQSQISLKPFWDLPDSGSVIRAQGHF